MSLEIRDTSDDDLQVITDVLRAAFGQDEEALLAAAILGDETARPVLSLMAELNGAVVGHVLFSSVRVETSDGVALKDASFSVLCPLAVSPEAQRVGVGKALVTSGLERLTQSGVAAAFVYGDPVYYNRFGFRSAVPLGLLPPYPSAQTYPGAWMVSALSEGALPQGTVRCAQTLSQPEFWLYE